MIINKKVLGELLLAAGYGKLASCSYEMQLRDGVAKPWYWDGEGDFSIEVETKPVAQKQTASGTMTGVDVLQCIIAQSDFETPTRITLDLSEPSILWGTELVVQGPVKKSRQLKRLGQLKGLTIESVKTVKQGTKAYIKTTDGAGICFEHAAVIQELAPDENIALGLLTKEDIASIAKAKKMGLLL